jgi:hypothetical protein
MRSKQKIRLPKLLKIKISRFSYLEFFTELYSLKEIEAWNFEYIDNIKSIFDPTKLIYLDFGKITVDPS